MRRIVELDSLRGLAAIGIVAFHYSINNPVHDRFLYAGVLSLELFFVLSGFLISSIILSHNGEPGFLRVFWLRRGLRIWPAYYFVILGYGLLVAFRPDLGSIGQLPYYLTFTQNLPWYWFGETTLLANPVQSTWSLAVEEQFYILWPLLIWLFGPKRMGSLAVAVILTAIAARLIGFNRWILIARCDGFAIGALLALALAGKGTGPARVAILSRRFVVLGSLCFLYLTLGLGLMGGRPFDMYDAPGQAINITVVDGFFACVVGWVVCHEGRPLLAPLRARWLIYLGTISYGIYLYHMAAASFADSIARRLGLPQQVSTMVVGPALCVGIASASWFCLEKPFLRLKDLFNYKRSLVRTTLDAPITAETPAVAPTMS